MSHNSKQNTSLKTAKKGTFSEGSLDTLAQPRQIEKNSAYLKDINVKDKFAKRARAKFLTLGVILKLVDLDSPLQKSYWNSYHCASYVEQKGAKMTCHYCKCRWCLVCNRIRIAKNINGYRKPLSELKNPQFVTLTNKNCKGSELKERIVLMKNMEKLARLQVNRSNKKGLPKEEKTKVLLSGIRKFECTYNPFTNEYNPHFHVILDGVENATNYVKMWIVQNEKNNIEISEKAQDIRYCNDKSMMELFKYFTKLVSSKGGKERHTTVEALDTIFTSIVRLQVYTPFGNIKKHKVSEDIEEIQAEILDEAIENFCYWIYSGNDWYSQKTGENLSGYKPSDFDKKYSDLIRTK